MLTIACISSIGSAAGLIQNGSFEADGGISNIKTKAPQDWNVSIPSTFGGTIVSDWKTSGSYSLRLVNQYYTAFSAGQNAFVYQQADLSDVTRIYFDINLRGKDGAMVPWDGAVMTAFVKIDANDIWVSGSSDNGVMEVNVPISNYTGIHTIKFGMRVNTGGWIYPAYWAQWDSITFDALCGGNGHFESDINRDCYVDFGDVQELADNWLRTDLTGNDDKLNLHYDNTIDLQDFAVLADQWMLCSDWQNDKCVEVPLNLDADLNEDGIVNFVDYAILMKQPGADYSDVNLIKEQWLQRSWLFDK
jgi:hypothetical protein